MKEQKTTTVASTSGMLSKDYQNTVKLLTDVFVKADKDVFQSFFAKSNSAYKVIVTIQSNRAGVRVKDGKVLGWCTVKPNWVVSEGRQAYEINISAEGLALTWHDIVGTLVHEMVHLKNILENKKDTSRNGTYHNAIFKESAMKALLLCYDDKSSGIRTDVSSQLANIINGWNMKTDCLAYRQEKEVKKSLSAKKTRRYEYTCPDCGQSFKTIKQGLKVMCAECASHPIFEAIELTSDKGE